MTHPASYHPYAGIGSRETPAHILTIMSDIGQILGNCGYTLRSGAAIGADSAFEQYLGTIHHREIFLPWSRYNGHPSKFRGPSPEALEMAASIHPNWAACSQGARKLHGRNMHIMLGQKLDSPVEFVICWTPDGRASGGTGQALRVAARYHIPVYNLQHEDGRGYVEHLYRLMKS